MYQPGVVVKLNGDTLHGFIDYSEWAINPRSIYFKAGGNGAVVKFTVDDIKYFAASVGHLAEYEKYEGPISTDVTNIDHLNIGKDSTYKTDIVFLRVLQRGKNICLYAYSDNLKTRYYISENKGDKPVELVYRIYYHSGDDNGLNRTVYEYTYKGQLYDAAAKAGIMSVPLKKYISDADYKEEALLYIVSEINGISEADLSKSNPSKAKSSHVALAIAGVAVIIVALIAEFSGHHR
jgi:hypothetical protein